jgi:Fe-S cluster assembly protein SufD
MTTRETPAADFHQHALALAAAQSAALAQQDNSPSWMTSLREQGAADFARTTWPGRKTEQWKYTSLQAFQDFVAADWGAAPELANEATNEIAQANSTAISAQAGAQSTAVGNSVLALDAVRLVFVDVPSSEFTRTLLQTRTHRRIPLLQCVHGCYSDPITIQ